MVANVTRIIREYLRLISVYSRFIMKQYDIQYSYGEQEKPLGLEDIKNLILNGFVNEQDKIWKDEISEWVSIIEFPEFKESFEKSKKIIAEESLQNKKNILLVDDDANILGLLKDLFKEFYNISTASNGMDALRQIHRKKPALIVLDVMLPRLSGFEVLKRIKMNKDTENIPVIMLTAKDSGEHKLLGISLEADEYIPKPFDISNLEKVVKKWLEKK